LAGGLAVLTGLIVPLAAGSLFLLWDATNGMQAFTRGTGFLPFSDSAAGPLLQYGLQRRAWQLGVILLGALGMVGLGWWDDKTELSPTVKFAGQLLIAAAVAASGIRITLFVENTIFSYAVTLLWILTVTNAFNFMDNMNGLCAGLGIIGSWSFAWSAAVQGQYLVTLLAFLTCGALIGFLPYNFPRAKAFLGDAGSHLIGYLLALLAVLPNFYSAQTPSAGAVFNPVFILAVPLADLVRVVTWRWRQGKPFYVGDTNHISHRLVRAGLSPTRAVLVIWLAAALFSCLTLF
jgi:UDP-GlcNAc:undecaprenyl-phosphate GlcNAc-1-phosphate transferase